MDIRDSVKGLLARTGLSSPDGRALYEYRVTDDEFARLERELKNQYSLVSYGPIDGLEAAGFCLFGAEWWRRNYEAGPWSWEAIFGAARIPGHSPVQVIYPAVELGLRFWKRRIQLLSGTRRGYLVTLACEGGLPLRTLRRQNVRLKTFLRAVLEDRIRFDQASATSMDLAQHHLHTLPESLQNAVVVALGASLVDAVAELLAFCPNPSDPVGDLDRRVPGWRGKLPLDVHDDAARDLLSLLIRDAVASSHRRRSGISVHTVLREVNGGWVVQRHLAITATATSRDLADAASLGGHTLPGRFEVYRHLGDGGREMICVASRFAAGPDGGLYVLEASRGREVVVDGSDAERAVSVEISSGRNRLGTGSPSGGGALGELPWVFAKHERDDGELRLLGQGSVRTRYAEVLVAAPEGVEAKPLCDGLVEAAGTLVGTSRVVWRVTGRVLFRIAEDSTILVETAAETDDFREYLAALPSMLDSTGRPLYRSIPRLLLKSSEDGKATEIPGTDLEWRPAGTRLPWKRCSVETLGLCEIRHVSEGQVRFQGRFAVLPARSTATLVPDGNCRGGALLLGGLGAARVLVESMPGVAVQTARDAEGNFRINVSVVTEPPSGLPFRLDFGAGRVIDIEMPFPVRAARFVARDGRPLPDRAKVSIEELGGIRAQVLAPGQTGQFVVEIALRSGAADHLLRENLETEERLGETFPGLNELDLAPLRPQLELMLTTTTDLDAYFDLRLHETRGQTVQMRRLQILRYERQLDLDKEAGLVRISPLPGEGAPLGCADLAVRAIPILFPDETVELGAPRDDGAFDFSPKERKPGPWILAAMEGTLCRVRPTRWFVPPGDGMDLLVGDDPSVMRRVVLLTDAQERREQFSSRLRELGGRPEDADWLHVVETLTQFSALPPTSHDMLVGLSRTPAALPALLLATDSAERLRAWDYLEHLPISWHVVPLKAWVNAATARLEQVRVELVRVLSLSDEALAAALDEHVSLTFAPLRARLPALELVEAWVRLRAGLPAGPGGNALALPEACFQAPIDAFRQAVLGRIGAERLPQWGGLASIRSRLEAEVSPQTIRWADGGVPGYSKDMLNGPACSAWACATGLDVSAEEVYHLRRLRAFDPGGFDHAYTGHLGFAIKCLRNQRPELLA